jgi:[acyl-carrier-protein] S-malonyltransferase
MGSDLFDARPDLLGPAADDILGWSLRELCLEGPEEDLTRTEHAQPALFAISYALWEELRSEIGAGPSGGAGHSLGEFTALCAAGSISYPAALRVVALRGAAMAASADAEPSGMAALIGVDADLAGDLVARRRDAGGRLEVANINGPGQVVVAGSADDIEWLAGNAGDLGVRRVIPLNVAGAFHSDFMAAAAEEVGRALAGVDFVEPSFPVWSNTTARPHIASDMAATLRSQVLSTVRFQESLLDMSASGIDTFLHVGPGDVTAAMAKRTVEGAAVHVVSSMADIPGVSAALVTIA